MIDKLYYGNTIFEWLTAFSIIAGSFVVARTLYWIFRHRIKSIVRKTKTKIDDLIIDQIKEPIVCFVILFGIRVGLSILKLPEAVVPWPGRINHFFMALAIAWLIIRIFEVVYQEYLLSFAIRTETGFDDQILPSIKDAVKFIIWALGITIGLNNAGYDVGALMAGLGIGGLAVAFAAKDTLANIFGGISVFVSCPFKLGDRIEIAGIDGWVTKMNLRSATITDFLGQKITLPNKIFTDKPVKNIDARPSYYQLVKLHLNHGTKAEKVNLTMNILKDIARKADLVHDAVWLRFDDIGDYSLDIQLWYAIKLWQPHEKDVFPDFYHKIDAGKTYMNLEILKEFEKKSIKLTFPIQTVEILSDSSETNEGSLFRNP
jgi:MscS family membrane protein